MIEIPADEIRPGDVLHATPDAPTRDLGVVVSVDSDGGRKVRIKYRPKGMGVLFEFIANDDDPIEVRGP